MDSVLDSEGMEPELLDDDLKVSLVGVVQVQPDHGLLVTGQPFAQLFSGKAFIQKDPSAVEAGTRRASRGTGCRYALCI